MDARHLTAWMLTGLAVAGCQSGGNTELMERELRLQEDRIYYLEDELARCCRTMEANQQSAVAHSAPQVAPPTPARRSAPPGPPAAIPDVKLEMPDQPVTPMPLEDMPSLFQPPRRIEEQGTAVRIRKTEASPKVASAKPQAAATATVQSAPPVRMRFASAEEAPANVAKDWSTAPRDDPTPAPREPVTIGAAPRRPSWSPYR